MAGQAKAPILFSPIKVGDMYLQHRICMGPMTRSRSPGEVANDMNALHYAQRATPGGLLITEGTSPSITAQGYDHIPGILTESQAAGWKQVCDAVHKKGGYICAQLWHTGRVSTRKFQPGNQAPVSASATKSSRKAEPARALEVDEIKFIVNEFRTSAKNSRIAGMDCIELHGAHGYLIDQFLQDSSNLRTDSYGGSIENRCRFLFEVLDAVLLELPASKVAIRLSPFANSSVTDKDPVALFSYILNRLNGYKLAYVQFTEPAYASSLTTRTGPPHRESKLNVFNGILKEPTKVMLTGGYELESAEEALATSRGQLIGFGRAFIVMPDLVERLRHDLPQVAHENPRGMYNPGPKGYIDYPTYAEEQKRASL
ncbi:hypothetical protein SmJEL517_g01920 [Synchytrium microbalum]|uniref:NADH:flavin oxidoreductase/NADH oxidase N-terminal domain-containing protein n=1 Tax=Synchytrium microbalum TaxID=1806994 RepID=A0A507C832_9FUNG|nr:uncharacterized protein SmJEL517_g01920 [Synchytrium microbalum]TPX35671.1 hypothetical protein SmJEL517_g01920 [Synchytrium microbalum]